MALLAHCELIPVAWLRRLSPIVKILSAYHLNGIFGNYGANSNGTVHPGGKFSEKKGNTFRAISFFSLLPEVPKMSVPLSTLTVPGSSR